MYDRILKTSITVSKMLHIIGDNGKTINIYQFKGDELIKGQYSTCEIYHIENDYDNIPMIHYNKIPIDNITKNTNKTLNWNPVKIVEFINKMIDESITNKAVVVFVKEKRHYIIIGNSDIWMIARRIEDDIIDEVYKTTYDKYTTIEELQHALSDNILPFVREYILFWRAKYNVYTEDDADNLIAENNLIYKILHDCDIAEILDNRLKSFHLPITNLQNKNTISKLKYIKNILSKRLKK